jgi:hypothetical protein
MQVFNSFQEVYTATAPGLPSALSAFNDTVAVTNITLHGDPKALGDVGDVPESHNIELLRDEFEGIENMWATRIREYEIHRSAIVAKALRDIQRKKQTAKGNLQRLKDEYDDKKVWLQQVVGLTPESDIPELDDKWTDEKWLD